VALVDKPPGAVDSSGDGNLDSPRPFVVFISSALTGSESSFDVVCNATATADGGTTDVVAVVAPFERLGEVLLAAVLLGGALL
jgi:hypothetical protein